MLGKEAAMTCAVAVEDVIEQHYNRYNTILWMQHVLLYYTIIIQRSLFHSQLRQLLAEHHKEEELLQVYVHP